MIESRAEVPGYSSVVAKTSQIMNQGADASLLRVTYATYGGLERFAEYAVANLR